MGSLPTAGFCLTILATCGIVFVTIHNEWKKNSVLDSQLNLNNLYKCEGLWVQCISSIKGQFQCDTFETALLGLPASVQALRGMMVLACILSVFAIIAGGVGLDCNSAFEPSQKTWSKRIGGIMVIVAAPLQCQRAFMVIAGILSVAGIVAGAMGQECIHALDGKAKLYSARAGGAMMIIAGALTLISASWYAAEVVKEFWLDQSIDSSFQYEFGAALYIAWVASGLALISGALLACCTCGDAEDEYDANRYTYKPSKPQPTRNAEYV